MEDLENGRTVKEQKLCGEKLPPDHNRRNFLHKNMWCAALIEREVMGAEAGANNVCRSG